MGVLSSLCFFKTNFADNDVLFSPRPNHSSSAPPYILPDPLPKPTRKPKPKPVPPETPDRPSLKRPLSVVENEDGIIDLAPTPKKPRLAPNARGAQDLTPMEIGVKRSFAQRQGQESPSKRRRLEEEGVVLMDGPDEVLDDGDVGVSNGQGQGGAEVIVIDD